MENANLKARLFDLIDERTALQHKNIVQEKTIKELTEEVDELKGELNTFRNVAEKRASMIREIARENNRVRQELALLKHHSPNEKEIREQAIADAIEHLESLLPQGKEGVLPF